MDLMPPWIKWTKIRRFPMSTDRFGQYEPTMPGFGILMARGLKRNQESHQPTPSLTSSIKIGEGIEICDVLDSLDFNSLSRALFVYRSDKLSWTLVTSKPNYLGAFQLCTTWHRRQPVWWENHVSDSRQLKLYLNQQWEFFQLAEITNNKCQSVYWHLKCGRCDNLEIPLNISTPNVS